MLSLRVAEWSKFGKSKVYPSMKQTNNLLTTIDYYLKYVLNICKTTYQNLSKLKRVKRFPNINCVLYKTLMIK